MAASSKDTRNEDIRLYVISVFLFACILVGGVFLGLSIVNTSITWLPTAGLVLVGAPWIFWLFVYIYSCCRPRFQFISKASAPKSPTMSAENPGGATTVVMVEEEEDEGASEVGDIVQRLEPEESNSNMESASHNSCSVVSQESEKAEALATKMTKS